MKFLMYIDLLMSGYGFEKSKHFAFHDEKWELVKFSVGDDIHYFSTHKATCSKCDYVHHPERCWPKASGWPFGLGSTFDEAYKKAIECTKES